MGLLILKKSKESLDLIKLQWILTNPLSKAVLDDLLERDNGRFKVENLLEVYPERPSSVSWLAYQAASRILGALTGALGISQDRLRSALERNDIRRTILNALLTCRKYGVQKPQRFYRPLMVVWNLTWRCNLRCKHCYQDAGPLRTKSHSQELTLDEKLAAVQDIADSLVPTLSFSGGEPLIDPHFWEVAQAARNLGIYVSLNTNGTLITDQAADRLAALNLAYVGVSIDSASSEFHDQFRGVPGSWEKTVQGIKRLVERSISTILSFTITRENYSNLPAIFRLAEELGMDKVMVYNFIPTGRGIENIAMDLTPEQREEALAMMYEYSASGGSLCSTAPQLGRMCLDKGHPEYIPLAHTGPGRAQELTVLAQIVGGCGIGRAYLALQPDGRITPCVYMPDVEIGHIRNESIGDVWENSELLEFLASRQDLKGHCGVCEHSAVCGGCRARAYAYFGDFKAPDPGCIRNRAYYEEAWKAGRAEICEKSRG